VVLALSAFSCVVPEIVAQEPAAGASGAEPDAKTVLMRASDLEDFLAFNPPEEVNRIPFLAQLEVAKPAAKKVKKGGKR
jgi:hypothetical protein